MGRLGDEVLEEFYSMKSVDPKRFINIRLGVGLMSGYNPF